MPVPHTTAFVESKSQVTHCVTWRFVSAADAVSTVAVLYAGSYPIWSLSYVVARTTVRTGTYNAYTAFTLRSYGEGPSTSFGQNILKELLNAARATSSVLTPFAAAMTSHTWRM